MIPAGKRINQYTRYLTVVIATVPGLRHFHRPAGHAQQRSEGRLLSILAWFFTRVTCVVTLVGGTLFLMWLGEQITSRGIGNGVSA